MGTVVINGKSVHGRFVVGPGQVYVSANAVAAALGGKATYNPTSKTIQIQAMANQSGVPTTAGFTSEVTRVGNSEDGGAVLQGNNFTFPTVFFGTGSDSSAFGTKETLKSTRFNQPGEYMHSDAKKTVWFQSFTSFMSKAGGLTTLSGTAAIVNPSTIMEVRLIVLVGPTPQTLHPVYTTGWLTAKDPSQHIKVSLQGSTFFALEQQVQPTFPYSYRGEGFYHAAPVAAALTTIQLALTNLTVK